MFHNLLRSLFYFAGSLACVLLLAGGAYAAPGAAPAAPDGGDLYNGGFECGRNGENLHTEPGLRGVVPNGWAAVRISDTDPTVCTTQTWGLSNSCDLNKCDPSFPWTEKLDGHDSLLLAAKDIQRADDTTAPYGKPYDLAVYQQFAATPGTDYSLSAWFLDLCGGSDPSSAGCNSNTGPYQVKVAGIDPYGGTDPLSPNVIQVESRLTRFDVGWWENLATAVTARSGTVTVFLRVSNPFTHPGSHAIIDMARLVVAPTARFVDLPGQVSGSQVTLRWDGTPSPRVEGLVCYRMFFDVQYRAASSTTWQDLLVRGEEVRELTFTAPPSQGPQAYVFRVRAHSNQLLGNRCATGEFPGHAYPGAWSSPRSVCFSATGSCYPRHFYVPLIRR